AMGIDVLDIDGGEAGFLEAKLHGASGANAFGMGRRDVVGIGTAAGAEKLGVDGGAALAGVLVFLEDDQAGAFAEDEAVAILVERPAGALGVVVAQRQGARG